MTVNGTTSPKYTNIITINNDKNSHHRASADEVRHAAGSQSLQRLQQAVVGWTSQELDDDVLSLGSSDGEPCSTRSTGGKSALHMAAWKGCLENVIFLVDDMGCDINAYSKAKYSYGKTAIFFALTQCRVDVVEYLLTKPQIHVAIVNNKGQSVRSLAASHDMPSTVLEKIQHLEARTHPLHNWWNFRATHSDGLEYGDLDPRFLERPLRPTIDVVTEHAVNLTCRTTRKGGFARRNPGIVAAATTVAKAVEPKPSKRTLGKMRQQQQQQQQQQAKVTASQHALTEAEQTIWDAALHTLQNLNCPTQDDDEEAEVWVNALVTIVLLGSKQRRAWVPQVVQCVAAQQHDTTWLTHRFDEALKRVHSAVDSDKESSDTPRRVALLQKLQLKVLGGDQVSVEASGRDTGSPARTLEKQRTSNRSRQQAHDLWRSPLGQKGRKQISGLSIQRNLVPSRESLSLRLPEEPTFVDTLAVLNAVIREVQQVSLVAIDTEWMDGDSDVGDVLVGTNRLSTFQVSYYAHQTTPTTSNGAVISHVVDLKPALSSTAYLDAARKLISSILDSSETLILGFSIGHDLKILEQFMGRKLQPTTMLDLQLLLGDGTLGLRACVAKYSRIPLSKEEQCSDWGRRPLSESQLRYAGLDAAILIYLLAAHESQIV